MCTPSRYGLLTGEYPFRAFGGKGVWGPAPIESLLIIDTETLTIADVFKNSGYDTAVVGKWHLGFGENRNNWQEPLRPGPQDLGFDYYFGVPIVNSAPPYVFMENDRIVGEVMKSLEAAGVADNTLVIFTSDNGGMFNLGGRNAAAKGHKINGDLLGSKPSQHAWGGAAVAKLVNTPNSDIQNGKIMKGAAPAQLYDLEADVNQTKNLYNEYPEVVEQMKAQLAEYKSSRSSGKKGKK